MDRHGSVEGPFRDFVKGMTEAQRLNMNERAQDLVTEPWGLILLEGWWMV